MVSKSSNDLLCTIAPQKIYDIIDIKYYKITIKQISIKNSKPNYNYHVKDIKLLIKKCKQIVKTGKQVIRKYKQSARDFKSQTVKTVTE